MVSDGRVPKGAYLCLERRFFRQSPGLSVAEDRLVFAEQHPVAFVLAVVQGADDPEITVNPSIVAEVEEPAGFLRKDRHGVVYCAARPQIGRSHFRADIPGCGFEKRVFRRKGVACVSRPRRKRRSAEKRGENRYVPEKLHCAEQNNTKAKTVPRLSAFRRNACFGARIRRSTVPRRCARRDPLREVR